MAEIQQQRFISLPGFKQVQTRLTPAGTGDRLQDDVCLDGVLQGTYRLCWMCSINEKQLPLRIPYRMVSVIAIGL